MQTRSQDTRPFQRSFLKVSLNTPGLDGRCAWVLLRGAIIAAAGPCVTSRLARHDCSLYFFPATETSARLCVSAGVRFGLQVRRRRLLRAGWAAALSSCSVYINAAGHLLGSSQDTHNLAHFLVCIRDLSLLVVSIALSRCTFVRLLAQFSPVSHSLQFSPGLPQLRVSCSLSDRAHFPCPEVMLPADDITTYEYLLTLRVF